MKEFVYKTIAEKHEKLHLSPPENPLFSVLHTKLKKGETGSCEDGDKSEPISITNRFYTISLKNIISGEVLYGRTKYNCTKGTLFCSAPDQTMVLKGMIYSSEVYQIAFHKDYLNRNHLFEKIKKYNFFNYNVNEALHEVYEAALK